MDELCESELVRFAWILLWAFWAWIRISSWFLRFVCFFNACWAFLQVYCFLQNVSIALLQSLVTNENDSIYFIYTQLSHAHRVDWKQNSQRILLCFARLVLLLSSWSAAVFCLEDWLLCRMHHTSRTHCVIPFPSAALPSEHAAADFLSCSCCCLLLPFFQSKLGDPHFFQERPQLWRVGVFNQNVVLFKNNLCVHIYIWTNWKGSCKWTSLWWQPSVESSQRCYKTCFVIYILPTSLLPQRPLGSKIIVWWESHLVYRSG